MAALAVVPALAGGVAAQEAPSAEPVQIRETSSTAYPSVMVTVSVATGMGEEHLEIVENGRPVRVEDVRPLLSSGRRLQVVLALDTSDSMRGAPLEAARRAARDFVLNLPDDVAIGLLTFSDAPRVVQPLTTDHDALLSALATLTATQRGTTLFDGVVESTKLFSGEAQRNIVLLTDGSDVRSDATLEESVAAARASRATIFSVGFEGEVNHAPLRRLAADTRGTFAPATGENVQALYTGLAGSLSRQFVVQYRSQGPPGAQVTVTVRTPAGSDTSFVLLPRAAAAPEGPGLLRRLLQGPWALVPLLAVLYLAMFVVIARILAVTGRRRRDRELARRMGTPALVEAEGATMGGSRQVWIPQSLGRMGQVVAEAGGFAPALERRLERAGLPITAGELVSTSVVGALLGGILGYLLGGAIGGAVAMLLLGAAPFVYVARRLDRRISTLQSQLPDILMILATSMRAGHSFLQAVDTVAKEVSAPAGPEFARVVAEIRLGRPFEAALNDLAERVGTDEFRWAVLAVNVQREVGGNLAEILDVLSETVREREQVRRQVNVLAAEGKLSIRILVALPLLLFLYLVRINYEYMSVLWQKPVGLVLIGMGVALMALGLVWARKVVRIDV